MFYIDLDMIVTGNIDNLLEYKGIFGTLKTDDFACEKNNKGGKNAKKYYSKCCMSHNYICRKNAAEIFFASF